ncbi:transposase [Bacillus nitratireducens]|uniref:transposase n=1 Tax=Bacillus nitratireducens TaxID=2026193 RepID=UPI001643F5C2|nr:transposase [Bacillus nitratireducens]
MLNLNRKRIKTKATKRIQPELQKAFSIHVKNFNLDAPKQNGNKKEELRFIGHYIRRPALSLKRIEEYNGQSISFIYGKIDDVEKVKTLYVEASISRLIHNILDE